MYFYEVFLFFIYKKPTKKNETESKEKISSNINFYIVFNQRKNKYLLFLTFLTAFYNYFFSLKSSLVKKRFKI